MVKRGGADRRVGIRERAVLVNLILKDVEIDGAGTDAVFRRKRTDGGRIGDTVGKIPQNVKSQRGAHAGEAMDFGGIAEFLINRLGGGGLQEFAEASAGVGETPGRQLDLKLIQGLENG